MTSTPPRAFGASAHAACSSPWGPAQVIGVVGNAFCVPGGGALSVAPPVPSAPDEIWYDPADPTPSLGGPLLVAQRAGPVDNRPVEARPDVLTYTGATFDAPVEVIGPVHAMWRAAIAGLGYVRPNHS